MSVREFTKELSGSRVESELIKTIAYSLISSVAVLVVLYYVRLRSVENFFPRYGLFIGLAVLSYALLVPAVRQIRAYRVFACMSGMMIGMTLGMIAGFLAGFFIGATNGMFVGGVFGMVIGIWFGTWMGGCCCGVMGFMEGIMAGFMGGLMGAMTAVMLLNDHLRLAAGIVFVVCAVIMGGLNYMIYTEMKQEKRQRHEGQMLTIILSIVLTTVSVWLMVYGPRSGLF